MLVHIVTCSNYFDLNKIVSLRTGVSDKKINFFAKFHTDFEVTCPFRSYKIFQCWIIQENMFPVLELITKIEHKCF